MFNLNIFSGSKVVVKKSKIWNSDQKLLHIHFSIYTTDLIQNRMYMMPFSADDNFTKREYNLRASREPLKTTYARTRYDRSS
jgi:hypothetical protein